MALTHLSLFSGIGGLDLAAEMAGFKTVGQCEWADFPTKVLEKHWPEVPRWRDIRTLTAESFYERTGLRTVDVISGGFPCQPFSVAGKRRGKEDDRYLWPEMLRVVQVLQPTWVDGENVAGFVNWGSTKRYLIWKPQATKQGRLFFRLVPVDAAHRRDRCAIMGYSQHHGLYAAEIPGGVKEAGRNQQEGQDAAGKFAGAGVRGDGGDVGRHRARQMRENENKPAYDEEWNGAAYRENRRTELCETGTGRGDVSNATGERRKGRDAEPGLGGVVDGIPSWMDRYWVTEPDIPRLTTEKGTPGGTAAGAGECGVLAAVLPDIPGDHGDRDKFKPKTGGHIMEPMTLGRAIAISKSINSTEPVCGREEKREQSAKSWKRPR